MLSNTEIIRLARVKDQVIERFDAGDWSMLATYLGEQGQIINSHSRLLRSLHWNDEDYPTCVAEVIGQLVGIDNSVLDMIEKMLEQKGTPADDEGVPGEFPPPLGVSAHNNAELDTSLASVMIPFEPPFDDVRNAMKKACSNCGLTLKAADDIWENSILIQDILNLISRSCIVIVDFTSKNANVMYETGIAHALGKEVIPVTQSIDDVPFDLKHHRVLVYDNNESGRDVLRQRLEERLRTIMKAHGWMSPFL